MSKLTEENKHELLELYKQHTEDTDIARGREGNSDRWKKSLAQGKVLPSVSLPAWIEKLPPCLPLKFVMICPPTALLPRSGRTTWSPASSASSMAEIQTSSIYEQNEAQIR